MIKHPYEKEKIGPILVDESNEDREVLSINACYSTIDF